MKTVDTLVKDIYEIIDSGIEVHEDDMKFLLSFIEREVHTFFSKEDSSMGICWRASYFFYVR